MKSRDSARMKYGNRRNLKIEIIYLLLEHLLYNSISCGLRRPERIQSQMALAVTGLLDTYGGGFTDEVFRIGGFAEDLNCHQGKCQQNRLYMIDIVSCTPCTWV